MVAPYRDVIDLARGVVTRFVTRFVTRNVVTRIVTPVTRFVTRVQTVITAVVTRYWLNGQLYTQIVVPTHIVVGATRIVNEVVGRIGTIVVPGTPVGRPPFELPRSVPPERMGFEEGMQPQVPQAPITPIRAIQPSKPAIPPKQIKVLPVSRRLVVLQ